MIAVETLVNRLYVEKVCQVAPVLTIVNRKGGAGKTSAAHNIAGVWGTWGIHVCLVDLDTAFNLSEACGYPEELRVHGGAWLASGTPEPWPVPNMPNCALLPSGAQLASGIERMEKLAIDRERYLGKILTPLRHRFDVLLLDTKPDLDISVTGGIGRSDPCPCDGVNAPPTNLWGRSLLGVSGRSTRGCPRFESHRFPPYGV